MKKNRVEERMIKQPFYEGGDKALRDFVAANIKYPQTSSQNGIEGDVHLRYEIDYKGTVKEVKIIGGLDDYCNDEAIRVVRLLKFVVPKIPRHLKVLFHKTLTIHFRIGQKEATISLDDEYSKWVPTDNKTNLNISYTILPAEKKSTNVVTYNYTLKSN